jgi:putative cation-transporting ATPase 1
MRKYIFVLIVFSLVLFCHSQEKNSITTGNLKGKVKTLKETIYEIDKNQNKTLFITEEERPYKVFFDERGNVVENEQYDSEGKVFLKYINIYTYHNNIIKSKESYCRGYLCMNEGKIITKYNKGLVIEITIYDDKGEVISTEKFQYDEKDKLIKETLKGFYYSEGGDFEIEKHPIDRVRTYNYKYENGNLIEETCSDGEIKRYDTKGRIVEERRLDYTDCFYNYDERNNLIKKVKVYHPNNSLERTETTYKYDNNNNLVEEIKSYGSKIFYRYDNRNNIIEKISTDGDKTTYKYDEKGNWIEKRQNNFLTERIIEYY